MTARSAVGTFVRSVALLLLLAALCAAALKWFHDREEQALLAPMGLTEAFEFTVAPGSSFSRVAEEMAQRGLVSSPRFFSWYARRAGKASAVKAGTYALQPGMTPLDALDVFVAGLEVQRPFTIVEGWSFADLRAALARSPHLEQTLQDLDAAQVMAALGRPGRHPEGMFLADTYLFPPGSSDASVLRRALAALESALDGAWQTRAADLPLDDADQGLILASIIEKETADPAERPRISGVFVERLRLGMLLQTDPTVIYGLGVAFDGDLRRRDLRTDTPYNTYTRKGLPPTPIAMVGLDAIRAAFNPRVDGSLFFVSRGDGSHQFSRTYDEHRRAVQRFQLRARRAPGS
jgi:UPF0755 protein